MAYNKVAFNEKGIEALETMAKDIQANYDEYGEAGNKLIRMMENCRDGIGHDADMIESLLLELNQTLTSDSAELIDAYEYCKKKADFIREKIGKTEL